MMSLRTRHSGYLVLFVFLIFATPRLNVRVGPAPLYAIDLVAALMLYFTSQGREMGERVVVPFRILIFLIALLVVASEVTAIIYGASVLDAVYVSLRYILAFSVAFTVPRLVQTAADVQAMLKAVALALLITSLLMICSSLPMTRWIAVLVFSISNLEPAVSAARLFSEAAADQGMRGRTLIGVSILSGAFISIAWPMVAYLRMPRFRLSAFWSVVSTLAVMIAPLAIAMTYSRQAALGTIMILIATLVLPISDLRWRLLRPVMLSLAFVVTVGAGSSLFFFERYQNRVEAMFQEPLSDERESHRLLSYVAPFEHVSEHPQFLIIGAGSNNLRSGAFDVQSFEENHSLIGAGYFAHGLISTLSLFFIVGAGYYFVNWHRKRSSNLPYRARGWPRSLYLAYLPILPMAAFAPALGNNIRAMYVYMLLLGLAATLRNPALLAELGTQTEQEQANQPKKKQSTLQTTERIYNGGHNA